VVGTSEVKLRHSQLPKLTWPRHPTAGSSKRRGIKNAILGEWQITGISSFVSGAPLQANRATGVDGHAGRCRQISTSSSPARPTFKQSLADVRSARERGVRLPVQPLMLLRPSAGQNAPGCTLHQGPAYWNTTSPSSRLLARRREEAQLRFSAYNFLNHPIPYPDDSVNLTADSERKLDTAERPDFGSFH